ncbi:MaoC/PaaZ C-terminal domain-containing protein [Actinokineospora sp. HUAS TT18]|uniref:MaoC/PaaZ C-terminal domain-containing protein n=1 Tax=Actinokineospora sp. HUAS TT18 TaxID=3447451 RepID=UPI003F528D18
MNELTTRFTASDIRAVTAAELATYRDVLRAALGAKPVAGGPQASPVYPFVLAMSSFDEIVDQLTPDGQPRPGNVHLSQEFRVRRLVAPGERVGIDVEVVAARREPKGVRLAIRCVVVGEDGAVVSELLTGALLVDATTPEPFGDMPAATELAAGPGPTERATVTASIPADTVRAYADASGDHNPIHLDEAAAIATGFPGVIAHGMSVLAVITEDVVQRFAGGDAARVTGIGCRFSAPILPDEQLEITYVTDGGPVVKFTCKTPRGLAFKGGWVEIDGRRHG